MKANAVFLDRDGTIIEDRGYIRDPVEVCLLPGAAEAIRRLSRIGRRVVLVSNQSGVARGLFDEAALYRVHAQVEELLKAEGAELAGAYYCPYLDGAEAVVEAYRRDSELRKPRPGMLLRAAGELGIDLSRSWMIGDSACDVEAGAAAGCRTIRILNGHAKAEAAERKPTHTAGSLSQAVEIMEREDERRSVGADPPGENGPQQESELVQLFARLSEQLDRTQRQERQHDFSVLRLFGALLQMFAIVAAVWGLPALLNDQAGPATARFTLACFLQIASLSAFAIDRFR